jgi:hypothetical protein
MRPAGFGIGKLTAASVFIVTAGCGGTGGTDYGWFSYAPPEGWARYEPPPGVTYAPTLVEFRPQVENLAKHPHLQIRDVTDQKSRIERIPELYAYARERDGRLRRLQAERQGMAEPVWEIEEVGPAIRGPGKEQGLSITMDLGSGLERQLYYFVHSPDGRRYRVDYLGEDPAFEEHRDAIVSSLASLRFAAVDEPEFSLEATVAALEEQLDGDRLWLYNGKVGDQRLNDRHLEALRDPAFAGVTDLNLVSGSDATIGGVDVTDEGLAHVTHLPLTDLIVRGSLVTDAGLAQLKGLQLEALVLAETLVEGEGLKHLSGMPLKVLDLADTRVGDESLQYLAGLPLISINLRGTRVTDAGVTMLERAIPGVLVSR